MSDRLIVVSDLHVGPDPVDEATRFNIFAGSHEFGQLAAKLNSGDHLVLNGDAFDFLLDDERLTLDRAVERAEKIVAGEEGKVVFAALNQARSRGVKVTLRVGNHDPELGCPEVQKVFVGAVPGLRVTTKEAEKIRVGGNELVVAHGELVDRWNRFDHDALPQRQGERFKYPPGSWVVKEFLNPAKKHRNLRFADLLKPDWEGAILATLAIDPGAAKLLFSKHTATISAQLYRRRSAPYSLVADEPIHRGFAELNTFAEDALHELLASQQGEELISDIVGRAGEATRAAWLRAAGAYQRWYAGDKGDSFMSLDPETTEWDLAQSLAAAHDVNVVLLGHTHAARIGQFGGLTLANSGTWIPLMRLPSQDAPLDEWVALLRNLQKDRSLNAEARKRLIHRFTYIEVRAEDEGLKVELKQQTNNTSKLLGSRLSRSVGMPRFVSSFTQTAGSRHDRTLQHRLDTFENELDAWADRNPRVTWDILTSREHLDILQAQTRAKLKEAKDCLSTDTTDFDSRAQRALVDAQAIWKFYRTADAQRRDPSLGLRLQHADAIAFDGYQTVLKAAMNAGLQPSKGARQPVPLVYLEPGYSPATYRRGAQVPAPTINRELFVELQFPVILVPEDHLAAPWWLTVLHHEVGHDLDHDLGLRAPLSENLSNSNVGPRLDRWRYWLSEIIADIIGLHLAGPRYIDSLREIAEPLVGWHWHMGSVHPPLGLRLELLCSILDQCWNPPGNYTEPELAKEYRGDVRKIVSALLDCKVGNTTFKGLLPKIQEDNPVTGPSRNKDENADTDTESGSGSETSPGAEAKTEAEGLWRLLPGRFQQKVLKAKDEHQSSEQAFNSSLAKLAREFDSAAKKLPMQQWQVSASYRMFITQQVPRLAPTILQPGSLYKVPPLELLRSFDEAWFVGVTNGQLLPRIKQARLERDSGWKRLVFFFLSDDGIAALAEGDETKRKGLIAERDAARKKLEEVRAYTENIEFATVRHPFVFASFWQKPGVRRVHVSAKVWGTDIRVSPAVDYRAVEGQEHPELETYFRGLAALCRECNLGEELHPRCC